MTRQVKPSLGGQDIANPLWPGRLGIVVTGVRDRRAYAALSGGGPFDAADIMIEDKHRERADRLLDERGDDRVILRPDRIGIAIVQRRCRDIAQGETGHFDIDVAGDRPAIIDRYRLDDAWRVAAFAPGRRRHDDIARRCF